MTLPAKHQLICKIKFNIQNSQIFQRKLKKVTLRKN